MQFLRETVIKFNMFSDFTHLQNMFPLKDNFSENFVVFEENYPCPILL